MLIRKLFIIVSVILLVISCNKDTKDPVCFVGDSLVSGWDVKMYFPGRMVSNKGVSGARVEDVLSWNLDCSGKDVVLLIGTNNLQLDANGKFSPEFYENFLSKYRQIIENFHATRVFTISILPRSLDGDVDSINGQIVELNNCLKELVTNMDQVYFVDVFHEFLYEGGMNPNYSLDGLHLNDLGYHRLSALLLKVI